MTALAFGGVLSTAGATALPASLHASEQAPLEATVNRVWDGSTLDAYLDGRRTAIGYLGAETPALNRPCGPEARERNQQLAGGRVLLESDPAYELDAVGRRLFYAYTADGVSIDETLVREGLARAVRTDAAHGADLLAAQAEAEAAGRGCLWSGAA